MTLRPEREKRFGTLLSEVHGQFGQSDLPITALDPQYTVSSTPVRSYYGNHAQPQMRMG